MKIEQLNELANNILVSRELIKIAQAQIDRIILEHPDIKKFQEQICESKTDRDRWQGELLGYMSTNRLKQWKTEGGTFSRAERITAKPISGFDKAAKAALLVGEKVEGWELIKKEYISIRANKNDK